MFGGKSDELRLNDFWVFDLFKKNFENIDK
jgi:hypothetical protein